MKRSFSCILALTCLLLLTACGKQGEANDPVDTPPALEKIAYAPEYHNIDLDCERVDTGYAVDGGIYLLEIHHRSDYGNSGSVVPNHISQAYYIPDYTTFWADYNPARENGGYGVLHKSEF